MKFTIYDWDNKPTEVNLPDDKKIKLIYVVILSGDETGTVVFEDNSTMRFDASDCRLHDYYDGNYVLDGKRLEEWINFDIDACSGTISYRRLGEFDGYEDEE